MTVSPDDLKELLGSDDRELKVLEKLLQIRETRLTFALDHHVNTRGDRMDFVHYPHIRALYESMATDMVLQGSVQSFKSEWAVIDHFAAAFSGLSVFYVVPKYEARNTYVQNRINKCVENVPEYKKIIGAGFFDSVALKSFGKGTVKYVGSNVLADFKEFPADMIVVEEVDECDADNVGYALDRLRASPYQFKRYLGNPKHKGYGINAFFQRSDQREWEVPCKSCGIYCDLDWFECVVRAVVDREGNVVDYNLRDSDWYIGCKRDIRCKCPNCGGELDRTSELGKWVARNPESAVEGYHISMLCSLINSVAGMWDRFKRGIHDPARMQQFYNSDLGLPYSAMGNKVTETILENCVDTEYEFIVDPDGSCAHVAGDGHEGPCSMGVDVGGAFDVRVSCVEPRGQRRAVYVGKVKNVDELHDIVARYNVEKCVMDSMPEITLAQEFQEIADCDVWLCSYRGEGKDRRRTYDTKIRVLHTDRTEALDRSFAQLKRRLNILPANYALILNGEYVSEMCMPVREIIETDRGESRYEWSKGKDHQRHTDTYDMLAGMMMMEAVIDDVLIG